MSESKLPKIFDWAWRAAVLVLPWQTRFIVTAHDNANTVYASWLVLSLVIVLGFFLNRDKKFFTRRIFVSLFALVGLMLLTLISNFSYAAVQWWFQILLLTGFAFTLVRAEIKPKSLAAMFVFSLIPHAVLGVEQMMGQRVIGSTLFGIAPQLAKTSGVAVVETAGLRFLRAYGGFPYPNIFGAWLVFGIAALIYLAGSHTKWRRIILMALSVILSAALVFTFSRSAWLALIALGFVAFWQIIKINFSFLKPILLVSLTLLIFSISTWPLLTTRIKADGRLEDRSLQERVKGYATAKDSILAKPFLGVGLNSLSNATNKPHNLLILSLTEIGVVGTVGFLVFLFWVLSKAFLRQSDLFLFGIPILFLAGFDHYLWSYWSGQSLVALIATFIFLNRSKANLI